MLKLNANDIGNESRRIMRNVTFTNTNGNTVFIKVYTVLFFKVSGGLVERKHWCQGEKNPKTNIKGIDVRLKGRRQSSWKEPFWCSFYTSSNIV